MSNYMPEHAAAEVSKELNESPSQAESEQCCRDTLNTLTDIITVHDNDYNIIKANNAARSMLNLPDPEKHKELKCYTYYHGLDAPPDNCPSCNCHETGMSTSFEIYEPHLNMNVEVRAMPRYDSENNMIGSIHIVRDVTERQNIVKKMENSEKRFKILFEYAPDTIFLLDMKGNILDGNAASERLTGYRVEELIGKNLIKANLVSAKHIPKAVKNIAKSALGSLTGPDEYSIKQKNGDVVDVEVRTYPVKISNSTQILGVARDISQRKKTEAELKERVDDLERFYEMAIGREVRMKDLKIEVVRLSEELARYKKGDSKGNQKVP
jgi:PAS domain S-box-containing protein